MTSFQISPLQIIFDVRKYLVNGDWLYTYRPAKNFEIKSLSYYVIIVAIRVLICRLREVLVERTSRRRIIYFFVRKVEDEEQ